MGKVLVLLISEPGSIPSKTKSTFNFVSEWKKKD